MPLGSHSVSVTPGHVYRQPLWMVSLHRYSSHAGMCVSALMSSDFWLRLDLDSWGILKGARILLQTPSPFLWRNAVLPSYSNFFFFFQQCHCRNRLWSILFLIPQILGAIQQIFFFFLKFYNWSWFKLEDLNRWAADKVQAHRHQQKGRLKYKSDMSW